MVAKYGKPVYHQFRVGVDKFVVGHPQRVVHAAHAFKMVDVSGGDYEFGTDFFGHGSHQFGYGLLVVITVAAEVVGDVEVEFLVEDGIIRYLCGCPVAEEGN